MIELARPGMDEGILYTEVMHRMVELGSEYYPMAFYSGPHAAENCRASKIRPKGGFSSPCTVSPTKSTRCSAA